MLVVYLELGTGRATVGLSNGHWPLQCVWALLLPDQMFCKHVSGLERLAHHVKTVGTALYSVLTALYSVLINAFRKTLLSGLEKLLEITLKSMPWWGAPVRILAINHVELVGQERTRGKNRKTLNLSGFLVSFSTIYITSHHSGKGIWKLQLKHPGYVASLFYAIISKYCCWVRPVILCESVRQHGPL